MSEESNKTALIAISVFLVFSIIILVYRMNTNIDKDDKDYKTEKYEEIKLEENKFLNNNVYNTGLGKKEYEYLVNYPNGRWSWGDWSWESHKNNNSKGDCDYAKNNKNLGPFKERNINNLFKF